VLTNCEPALMMHYTRFEDVFLGLALASNPKTAHFAVPKDLAGLELIDNCLGNTDTAIASNQLATIPEPMNERKCEEVIKKSAEYMVYYNQRVAVYGVTRRFLIWRSRVRIAPGSPIISTG